MADAYVFQASLLCETCAQRVINRLSAEEVEQDCSDTVPQGPYSGGGGEADTPQHCDHCGEFLENPLTGDGYNYVQEMASDPTSHSDVVKQWIDFYEITVED